ncbi:hypothetical protein KQI63_16045 [bacterium]|nr:hypothetical protein [bacterium]
MMKRLLLTLVLITAMVMLTGCGSSENTTSYFLEMNVFLHSDDTTGDETTRYQASLNRQIEERDSFIFSSTTIIVDPVYNAILEAGEVTLEEQIENGFYVGQMSTLPDADENWPLMLDVDGLIFNWTDEYPHQRLDQLSLPAAFHVGDTLSLGGMTPGFQLQVDVLKQQEWGLEKIGWDSPYVGRTEDVGETLYVDVTHIEGSWSETGDLLCKIVYRLYRRFPLIVKE